MTKATIYTDVQISKAKRAHVTVIEDESDHRWHITFGEALAELVDRGITECTIDGEGGSYQIQFSPLETVEG